jgi:hypothetical protein
VDELLTRLVQERRVDTAATVWLFPGTLAGRPFNAGQQRGRAVGPADHAPRERWHPDA